MEGNRARTRKDPEFELIDTGVFNQDRYFDVFTEYAKAAPNDILIRATIVNRGPEPATLHLLPTLWFRNTWRWRPDFRKPTLRHSGKTIEATEETLGSFQLSYDGDPPLLFTENESNAHGTVELGRSAPLFYQGRLFIAISIHGRDVGCEAQRKTGTKDVARTTVSTSRPAKAA